MNLRASPFIFSEIIPLVHSEPGTRVFISRHGTPALWTHWDIQWCIYALFFSDKDHQNVHFQVLLWVSHEVHFLSAVGLIGASQKSNRKIRDNVKLYSWNLEKWVHIPRISLSSRVKLNKLTTPSLYKPFSLITLWHKTPSNSLTLWTQAGCSTIQFNSFTSCLNEHQTP